MKVLVSTDIEGIAGVFHVEQTRTGNGEYERARRWMTAEANAAIEGAFAGGAQQVFVNDSHGGFRNLLPDMLDSRAQIILGKPRYLGMMAGVEYPCDVVFMIGYHARAQSRGILAHTINSFAFARLWLDDAEVSEADIYGALAEEYGAHVALITGDDVLCAETQPRFPLAHRVQTKTAAGFATGTSLTPVAACSAIREAAEAAIESFEMPTKTILTQARKHYRCRVEAKSPALADLFCQWPTLVREDGVTIAFNASSIETAVRTFNCLSAMSTMLR